ncbi:hypothetical protein BHM03_00050154 [Ensete ventricosum]|nr:hypothetical protein BHM03_00050154 [Ensete ventricosum]
MVGFEVEGGVDGPRTHHGGEVREREGGSFVSGGEMGRRGVRDSERRVGRRAKAPASTASFRGVLTTRVQAKAAAAWHAHVTGISVDDRGMNNSPLHPYRPRRLQRKMTSSMTSYPS